MTDSCVRTVPLGTPVQYGELLDKLQHKSPFPLSVTWSLTSRCNLDCRHCAVPRGAEKAELPLGDVLRILDEMASCGVLMLSFTGGEPTLREDLPAIVVAAKVRRFSVRLKTNGVLLDGSLADTLADAGLSSVSSSIYSIDPAEHDAFVGRAGAFESTCSALRRMKARGVRISVGFILMGWNIGSVPGFLDLCEAEGFSFMVDAQITPREDGNDAPQAFQADKRQIETVFADPRLLVIEQLKGVPSRHEALKLCAAGDSAAFINHNGDLWPCANMVLPMGNLQDAAFGEIWLESEVRKKIAELRWADLHECRSCNLSGICMRCMGAALLETGDIRAKSKTACIVAEAISALCRS